VYHILCIIKYPAQKNIKEQLTVENKKFCQSCAMPLEKDEDFATNACGSKNEDYCIYCYKDGAFTADCTMDEMIEVCVAFSLEAGVYKDADEARTSMRNYFPSLKRWASA